MTDIALTDPGAAAPTRAARAGALMAASTLAMAAASALQAVLYLGEYGATARTDAFFAAFALYQVVGVFTQTMRLSSVPLLVGKQAIGALGFFGALAVLAVPLVIVCGPLASATANLLAPSAHGSAHTLAMNALRILGVAMVLQMMAAGAATLLGMRDRFEPVAAAYAMGALTGLVVFIAVRTTGELSLGWSMLAMAIVTSSWMLVSFWRVRRAEVHAGTGGPGFGGDQSLVEMFRGWARSAGNLLGRSIVYFVINAFFLITLAEVGRSGGAGATTVLSYAYLLASYLVAGTSTAVGISRAPDMVRGAQEEEWSTVVADTVPHGYQYAALVCAPALAAGVLAATPVVKTVLPNAFTAGQANSLATSILLLALWTAAALMLNFAIPALFALGRARVVNVLAIGALALHVAATLTGRAIYGVNGITLGLAVAPLVFGIVLVAIGAKSQWKKVVAEVTLDTLRFAGLSAVAFGGATALAIAAGASDLVQAAITVILGGILYLVGVRLAAPRAAAVLLGAGRGRGAKVAAE